MRKIFSHTFKDIINVDNLFKAWKEFASDKKNKRDVLIFSSHLMDNIISLHQDLSNHNYKHAGYQSFKISDPKPRDIHKATVRDRLLHHAIYRQLYPFFDKLFITDSYSCRLRKGTFKALERFMKFSKKVSKNDRKTCWLLKCDIRKFFANIDHETLLYILKKYVSDSEIIWLLNEVIHSFKSIKSGVGLPLGNLTSQLLVNIYMNEFDQFLKHKLKVKYYIRYADDFVIMSQEKGQLKEILLKVKEFLQNNLKLELHPNKISIKTLASGLDFLGWVNFPDHRTLRTSTKKRMFRNIKIKGSKSNITQSYLGLLSHGNGRKLRDVIHQVVEKESKLS